MELGQLLERQSLQRACPLGQGGYHDHMHAVGAQFDRTSVRGMTGLHLQSIAQNIAATFSNNQALFRSMIGRTNFPKRSASS